MISETHCDRRPRKADDAGLGDQAGHSVLRQDRARPRSADGQASIEVALGLPHEARGGEGTRRSAVEVRSWRVRRADAADARRLPDEWLAAIEHTVRPSTFDSYSRNMHNHVIAHIGSTRLTRVDAGVLNGLYALLLTSGRRLPSRTGRGYSPEVVARAPRAAGRRAVARRDGRAAASRVGGGIGDHEEHARLAAAPTVRTSGRRRPARRPQPSNRQLRPHDPAPRVQGRCPLGPSRAQPDRRRRPTSCGAEGRRRSGVGRSDAAHVPVSITREPAIACTRCGCCSRRPACDAARRSASDGRTSTSTTAGSASSRRSRRRAAR